MTADMFCGDQARGRYLLWDGRAASRNLPFTDGPGKGDFAGKANACLILASQDHRLVRTRRELAVHATLLHELEWHGLAWRINIANASG